MNYESLKLVNDNNKKIQQMKEQKKLKNRIKKIFKKHYILRNGKKFL